MVLFYRVFITDKYRITIMPLPNMLFSDFASTIFMDFSENGMVSERPIQKLLAVNYFRKTLHPRFVDSVLNRSLVSRIFGLLKLFAEKVTHPLALFPRICQDTENT